jgi:hypothetical protein
MSVRILFYSLNMAALTLTASQARQPEQASVEVMRGGSVEIPLPVPKGNFNQLVYSIIEEARYGRFSDLTQQIAPSGQRHWQVTYTHGNDNSSVSDRLFFEVSSTPSNNQGHRGQGRKHSRGRGIVYIRVLDAAP